MQRDSLKNPEHISVALKKAMAEIEKQLKFKPKPYYISHEKREITRLTKRKSGNAWEF
jgi:hypothetical protein